MGEVLFFAIYVAQQLGVMLGVGAQTVLLCTHLLSVHRNEPDAPHASYAAAARTSLQAGFFLIIISGFAAAAVHLLGGNWSILFAPAFAFKWLLILVVLGAFIFNNHLLHWSNTLAWVAGGSWYALFLVHSLAPVTSWFNLGVLYAAWMAAFGIVWGSFLLLMHNTAKSPAKPFIPKPALPPVVVPKPTPPPPAPKPIPPLPPPAPVVVQPLPPTKPLSLPTPPPPIPKLVPPVPSVALAKEGPPTKEPAKHGMLHDVIDHLLVPALRIMPQTPAEVGKQNRPPVVKLD